VLVLNTPCYRQRGVWFKSYRGCILASVIVVDPHQVYADPDSTYHPDADPDLEPDPSFQIKAQTLEKC
jgi:hypothetical protein